MFVLSVMHLPTFSMKRLAKSDTRGKFTPLMPILENNENLKLIIYDSLIGGKKQKLNLE